MPGKMIAAYLLKRGLTVTASFADVPHLEAFVASLPKEWKERFRPAPPLSEDMGKAEVEAHLEAAVSALGGLDLYIHAEPWADEQTLQDEEPETFVHQVNRRLRQLFYYCQAAGRMMAKKKRGQIIIPLLADTLHWAGYPSSPVYNQGAISFVKSLAKELSPFGISVNVFEFGYYQEDATPLGRADRKRFELFALKAPVPRLAEAVEGLGLLLDYGGGMSGQVIQWGYGIPPTTL